ncbi:DUF4386 domain-containing protein [Gaoshiqia sediminis]|uniref:DUF4386 domain-containing protein n=1 Tax=Gaoshiqia sediminis TaxID=2986998 RepID=A0AA41YBK5_9BACT|nr:DUF4386 domain-containing protein [Gaoshiqia sediminis]MCW0483055.1 DUF4386 domain-containing protein [Gaoshiqia sediminis]
MHNKEKKQGIIAGISLVIMAIVAGFSFGYAHNNLVTDSPENTLNNLIANKSLFFAELSGWSLILITDLIVAIALYFFFSKTSKQISTLTASIRIIYTLILGIAIVQLFKIIPILSSGNPISDELTISETASHIQLFEKLWSIGLIIFGLHLIGLGYLSVKSKSVPGLLGYLLYFGGISYTFLHSSRRLSLFNTNILDSVENILALPMALAEILLAFWLIYNGFRKSVSKIKA